VPEQHEEVAFVGGTRQWSVPISVAIGAIALIGLWPTPHETTTVGASQQSLMTRAQTSVEVDGSLSTDVEPAPMTVSPAGESEHPGAERENEIVPLGVDLLLLGEPSTEGEGVAAADEIEVPTNESASGRGEELDRQPSDPAESAPIELDDEPTGSDVLQVFRWIGGAIAVSAPAESDVAAEVSRAARLAWEAQRQAVVEGATSSSWYSALAYRTGFARVLTANFMASFEPPDVAPVMESAFTVTEVRIDTAGRAIASVCIVEDSGFGSFTDTQGEWGSVSVTTGLIGLVSGVGGWTVDDVGRVMASAQC
jgi:hypothetical protein